MKGVNQDGMTEATRAGHLSRGPLMEIRTRFFFHRGTELWSGSFIRSGGKGADARVGGGPRVSRAYIRVGSPFPHVCNGSRHCTGWIVLKIQAVRRASLSSVSSRKSGFRSGAHAHWRRTQKKLFAILARDASFPCSTWCRSSLFMSLTRFMIDTVILYYRGLIISLCLYSHNLLLPECISDTLWDLLRSAWFASASKWKEVRNWSLRRSLV